MQSTWENVVDYDLSESGVLPVSLRELAEMGFDLEWALDTPLTYSQSNGTPELRQALAEIYPGTTPENFEVTNGTSEANYLVALSLLRDGDGFALEVPNYMQLWGVPRSMGAEVSTFQLRQEDRLGARLGSVRAGRDSRNPPHLRLQPQQPHRVDPVAGRHGADRRAVRRNGRISARRRGLSGRRDRLPADPQLLGNERQGRRHQRSVQGLRHSGCSDRLDRRPAGAGSRVLDPARFGDDLPEQALRCGGPDRRAEREPGEALRTRPCPAPAESTDLQRLGRRVGGRFFVHPARGRRHGLSEVRLADTEPGARGADPHQTEHSHRTRHPPGSRGLSADLVGWRTGLSRGGSAPDRQKS